MEINSKTRNMGTYSECSEKLPEDLDIATKTDLYLSLKDFELNVISEIKMTIYKVASLIIVAIFMLALFI